MIGALTVQVPARVSSATTSTWANGVKDTENDNGSHTYELPSTRDGVAHTVTVTPRWGGLRGPRVEATDAQGHSLEGSSFLAGFHRAVSLRDSNTGIETVLDPKEQTLEVQNPENRTVSGSFTVTRVDWSQEARESVDAQGNIMFFSDASGHLEVAHGVGPAGAYPVIVENDSTRVETSIPKGGAPASQRTFESLREEKPAQALTANLANGTLTITEADGASKSHTLFINPA